MVLRWRASRAEAPLINLRMLQRNGGVKRKKISTLCGPRLKTPLRSTVTGGRLSSLAIFYNNKHKDIDIDEVVTLFARLVKGRRLEPLLVKPLFLPLFYPNFCCRLPRTLEMGKINN